MSAELNLSRPDWAERIRSGASLLPDIPQIDRPTADRAVSIFNKLKLPDVRGTPTLAEAGADWFREIVAALLGAVDPVTGARFIRGLFLLAPKKSSKTTYGAALMLTALLMNTRPRAELLLIAPTKLIADLSFGQAVGMIEADPFLKAAFHVQDHLRQITDRETRAQLKIKAFDTNVLTGVKPVAALVDELHEIAKSPDARRIIGQLRGGLLPNPEGFLAFISTQSDQPPAGVFRSELNTARGIRDGRIKGGDMLPILYEFPEDMIKSGVWRETENWWMVTPNRDRSVTVARLAQDFERAQDAGDEEVLRWASQHLNLEIGLALRSDRWVGADLWQERGVAALTLDTLIARSEVLVVGIDGGGLDDLLGLAVLGRDAETREWLLWVRAWARDSVLERRKSEASRLRDFAAAGDLVIVINPGDDIKEIGDIVERLKGTGKLAEKNAIGLDPAGIGQIIDEIAGRGIEADQIVGVSQGWKLNGAIKTTERKLDDGTLTHAAQPLMAWSVSNAKVEPKGNAIVITKAASGTAKIDPLMAALNAVHLMTMNPEANGSVYSATRGLLFV